MTMQLIWSAVNLVVMVVLWKFAMHDFENGYNTMGWINIFFSAWNGASLAQQIF